MAEYVTNGNLRSQVLDPDEPFEGFKKKTWVPPAEWGPGVVWGEGVYRGPNPVGLGVPYETLYFQKTDCFARRLIRPVHGYDTVPSLSFNDDDLCPVQVAPY